MNESHSDYEVVSKIVDAILTLSGGLPVLKSTFPVIVQDAVDYVVDPI